MRFVEGVGAKPRFDVNNQRTTELLQTTLADEIQGDNQAAGQIVLTVDVPPDHIITVYNAYFASKVNPVTFQIVSSENMAAGHGSQVVLDVRDVTNAIECNTQESNCFTCAFDNDTGILTYVHVYLPRTRAGAATNNAATEYLAAKLWYDLRSKAV